MAQLGDLPLEVFNAIETTRWLQNWAVFSKVRPGWGRDYTKIENFDSYSGFAGSYCLTRAGARRPNVRWDKNLSTAMNTIIDTLLKEYGHEINGATREIWVRRLERQIMWEDRDLSLRWLVTGWQYQRTWKLKIKIFSLILKCTCIFPSTGPLCL